jgi:hypothetical protein
MGHLGEEVVHSGGGESIEEASHAHYLSSATAPNVPARRL